MAKLKFDKLYWKMRIVMFESATTAGEKVACDAELVGSNTQGAVVSSIFNMWLVWMNGITDTKHTLENVAT